MIVTFKKKEISLVTVLSRSFKNNMHIISQLHCYLNQVSKSFFKTDGMTLVSKNHRKNSFPLKEIHIVVPCWPPSSSCCRERWKKLTCQSRATANKKTKIKTKSAIFYVVCDIKVKTFINDSDSFKTVWRQNSHIPLLHERWLTYYYKHNDSVKQVKWLTFYASCLVQL